MHHSLSYVLINSFHDHLCFLLTIPFFLWREIVRDFPLLPCNIVPFLMFLTYGWYPPIFSIKNAKISFGSFILLFIWWQFGKKKDLYIDAQVASHPCFLSAPYFRCHHADVSLSFHLLLIKSHFPISALFL